MSVNAATVPAGRALEVLRSGWKAQRAGQMTASWMLHGRPGVGKTQIVQQLAQALGAPLFDLRLTTIEPQDLRGLPYYDHDTQKTVWYRPEDLPDAPDQPALLFLDELTAAAPTLQPTVYGLLQERRVGRHKLPDSVFIVAAGNHVEDGAIAYEMGTALSDRLIHLNIEASANDWIAGFAVPNKLHPAVIAFIRTRPDLLDTTDAALQRGDTIACTPRSWDRVSQVMYAIPDRTLRSPMIAGIVGLAVGSEFALIADDIAASVQIPEILSTPRAKRAALLPGSMHGLSALVFGLVTLADQDCLPAAIEVLADLPEAGRSNAALARLPLQELASLGFELLIRKGLDNGWEETFAQSDAYRSYAAQREAAGVV